MTVELTSWTTAPHLIGPDATLVDLIAYYARVSNPTSQENGKGTEKLVRYLLKHQHWSPLEMVHATCKIVCSRSIGRQVLRHRSFSFQEWSQRYAATETNTPDYVEARLQDLTNRQSSLETDDPEMQKWWRWAQDSVSDPAFRRYDEALKLGIAKEQARSLLPEGLTRSTMFMSGSIRSWVHFVQLRTGPETQKECRDVAHGCAEQIAKVFPMIEEFVQT